MKWIAFLCVSTALGTGVVMWQNGVLPLLRTGGPPNSVTQPDALGSSRRSIFAAGVVEGAKREVPLNFEISGRLLWLDVAEGDTVSKGRVLARQDTTVLRENFAEAQAQLQLARAERERLVNGAREETRQLARTEAKLAAVRVEQADADFQRIRSAMKQNAVSDQQFDDARFRLKIAEAQWQRARARLAEVEAAARPDELRMAEAKVQTAHAQLRKAQTRLDKATLRAPTHGIILDIDAEPGELVGPDRPEPIITLVDHRQIRVRAYVEELDVLSLEVGQSAYVTADGMPDKKFTGTITWIAPSMQPKRHRHHTPGERLDINVREVLIQLDEPGPLVIGLPVDVFIDPSGPDADDESSKSQPRKKPRNIVPSSYEVPQLGDAR